MGNYISLVENNNWQVKRIEINPGESIYLQKHKKSSEHWVVVKGIANVEIGNKMKTININESIFVSKGKKHRLSNLGDENLIIVEVQIGDYFGEDDIIRVDDYLEENNNLTSKRCLTTLQKPFTKLPKIYVCTK